MTYNLLLTLVAVQVRATTSSGKIRGGSCGRRSAACLASEWVCLSVLLRGCRSRRGPPRRRQQRGASRRRGHHPRGPLRALVAPPLRAGGCAPRRRPGDVPTASRCTPRAPASLGATIRSRRRAGVDGMGTPSPAQEHRQKNETNNIPANMLSKKGDVRNFSRFF